MRAYIRGYVCRHVGNVAALLSDLTNEALTSLVQKGDYAEVGVAASMGTTLYLRWVSFQRNNLLL